MQHYNKLAAMAAKKSLLCTAVLAGLAMSATALAADDGTLTWNGVTLYGIVDIGVAYQSHGAPLSQDQYVGLDYLVSKNGNKSTTSVAPNGLSQSKVGLKGTEKITDGLDFVFNLEMGFNPTSGRLSDATASLVHNNGLALTDQKTGADGSRAGQVFNGPAFAGVSSKEFGTLTLGRHNTVLTDVIGKDDPQGGSYAFSVIGYSGATAGGGNTENVRADNSVKYNYKYENFRVAAMWQFGKNDGSPGDGGQISVGADFGGLSVDGVYAFKNTSIAAGSLSAAQIAPCTGTKVPPACGLAHDSLAATISDNESWTLAANYKVNDQWKLFGGYEQITYSNPSNPLAAGFDGLGGYTISVTNNNAYAFDKKLKVSWVGAKAQLTKEWSLTGGYYHYDQNDFHSVVQNGVAVRAPCSNVSAAQCSGNLDAFSFVVDYRFTKRFDTYAGFMYSKVADGLANGYLHDNNTNVMAGFRFQF
ncbi:porin [Rudaea cellulosilytica]|uniref:porin n=1 Tax=Rudaea cellulosilytica TaxID=540746 RepID=UPI000371B0FD|nr:porin [Rudaea cellulosilytica]